MKFYKNYFEEIVAYDLLTKFIFKQSSDFPKITKIILSLEYKNPSSIQLISSLLALEIIGIQKASLITTSKPNINIKIRKGQPIGCKVTLRNTNIYNFLSNFLLIILPQDRQLKPIQIKNKKSYNLSLKFNGILTFSELENYYQFFKLVSNLSVVIVTNSNSLAEFLFLLVSLKLPCVKKII